MTNLQERIEKVAKDYNGMVNWETRNIIIGNKRLWFGFNNDENKVKILSITDDTNIDVYIPDFYRKFISSEKSIKEIINYLLNMYDSKMKAIKEVEEMKNKLEYKVEKIKALAYGNFVIEEVEVKSDGIGILISEKINNYLNACAKLNKFFNDDETTITMRVKHFDASLSERELVAIMYLINEIKEILK